LPHLIKTYKIINKPIIKSDYSGINYKNLIDYIGELKQFENDIFNEKIKKNNNKIKMKLKEIPEKYNKFLKFMKLSDNIINKKIFYLENGIIIKKDNKLKLLIKNFTKNTEVLSKDKIENYLEGYQFIFDLYFKGDIINYKWLYQFDKAPSLKQIYEYLKDKNLNELNKIFDYSHGIDIKKNLKYFDLTTYKKYIDDNKNNIFRDIIKKIMKVNKIKNNQNIDATPLTSTILTEYFTYENIETIYKCYNSLYIQHCINSDIIMINSNNYDTNIRYELLGGGLSDNTLYQKYIKYKNKYLLLKKNFIK